MRFNRQLQLTGLSLARVGSRVMEPKSERRLNFGPKFKWLLLVTEHSRQWLLPASVRGGDGLHFSPGSRQVSGRLTSAHAANVDAVESWLLLLMMMMMTPMNNDEPTEEKLYFSILDGGSGGGRFASIYSLISSLLIVLQFCIPASRSSFGLPYFAAGRTSKSPPDAANAIDQLTENTAHRAS